MKGAKSGTIPRSEIVERIPPLEPGDHLSRAEFERRYNAMPRLKKAELLEGVVHMPSPVRWEQHGTPHSRLDWWLVHYQVFTPGVNVGNNASIRLDLDTEPQPDVAMIIEPAHGGRVVLDDDGYISGAPNLIAEVSASTVSIDTQVKQRLYLQNGVREYLIWRVQDGEIDWYGLRKKKYQPLARDQDGVCRSTEFPGLWLNVPALVGGDLAAVLQTLQLGLASPAHKDFVERLRQGAGEE